MESSSITQKDNNNIYKSLIKLNKKEMRFVEDDWHHACLTYMDLKPTDDVRCNDFDYTFEEIENIIKTYGKKPSSYLHCYCQNAYWLQKLFHLYDQHPLFYL